MLLAITLTAAISAEIDLGSLFKAHRLKEPAVTCGIKTVGYRFEGTPGQSFRYAGETFQIPSEGWIELIADRRSTTYRINDRSLPLDVWPTNQFGFREVPLPSPETTTTEKETAR